MRLRCGRKSGGFATALQKEWLRGRAGGGGEFGVGLGDYAGLERGPAGVGGGIAAEADESVGNFGRADGAV